MSLIKKSLRHLSSAFVAGVVGAVALMLAAMLARGLPHDLDAYKADLYRLLIWGGIWAFLLVIPVFKNKWFLRGSIIGLMVILFNFLVLMPLSGKGFFGVNIGWSIFIGNIVFNYIWGIVAALWYDKIMIGAIQ